MRIPRSFLVTTAVLVIGAAAARPLLAGGQDTASGVASKTGDASPPGGLSAGETTSRADDYINQDEQINIDGGKDSVVKVLRVNQKNLVNDFVVGVFPIQHANPREIRSIFRTITAKEGGRAEVIRDREQGKAYLMAICPRFQLPYIEEAIQALDEDWVKEDLDGSAEIYYKARFRTVEGIDAIAKVPGSGDGETTIVDQAANAIWKKGEPYRMKKWLETAQQVDLFPPQLMLEAAIYEVELANDVKLGLDYIAWKCGPGRDLFRFVCWGFESYQKATNVTSIFDPFVPERELVPGTETRETSGRGCYASFNFALSAEYLDFLVRNGRARLVTSGRLNVAHGQIGTMDLTDEVIHFVPTVEEEEEDTAHTPETYTGRCLHQGTMTVGFTLVVQPFIGTETTELHYTVVNTSPVGVTPAGAPILRTSASDGVVLVRDGTPVCVGGLTRSEDVKKTAKMPVLGSIPILGWLFGGEQNSKHQTELVVVLTPQVVQYSEVDKELASDRDRLVRDQVARKLPLPMLRTEFGFDQWLLGRD